MTSKDPGNVPRELVRFFEQKKLKPAWSYRDVWGDEHRLAFTAAKVMEEDLLADIRDAVVRAQNEGLPFAAFRKELEPILAAKGWWGQLGLEGENKGVARARRLQTIYDTNLRQARRHGQYDRTQRRAKVQPFLRWRLGPSHDHRPEHVAFDGLIYPANHVFWKTHFPPTAFGCRCWIESLTRRQAEALGGVSPELDKRLFPDQTYRDPRSGKKRTVPYGVEPGFEFTPGISGRTAGVRQALKKAVDGKPASRAGSKAVDAIMKVALPDLDSRILSGLRTATERGRIGAEGVADTTGIGKFAGATTAKARAALKRLEKQGLVEATRTGAQGRLVWRAKKS